VSTGACRPIGCTGTGACGPAAPGYHRRVTALEAFYTGLLVLSAVVIVWFSVFVVWRLYKGQR
jgi:hypothetical protein